MKIDKSAYGENYNKERNDMIVKVSSVAVCVLLILVIGILAWALPQPTYSEYEKRDLNQMPEFSIESLFKGEYTLGVELAYADTFTFREAFVRLQAAIEEARGIRVEGAAIYGPVPGNTEDEIVPPSSETESQPSTDSSSVTESQPEVPSSGVSSENDSFSQEESSEPEVPEDEEATGETVAGIFVYKGIGFELFGGSKSAAEYYASVINKYGDAFGSSVNVYNMLIPKHAEFYPFPRKYANLSNSEKDSIDYIYSMVDSDVTTVDAYSVLEEHSDEYIYFNTDHHWTGLGAYYAYTAFMDAAGLSYYDYDSYTKHVMRVPTTRACMTTPTTLNGANSRYPIKHGSITRATLQIILQVPSWPDMQKAQMLTAYSSAETSRLPLSRPTSTTEENLLSSRNLTAMPPQPISLPDLRKLTLWTSVTMTETLLTL